MNFRHRNLAVLFAATLVLGVGCASPQEGFAVKAAETSAMPSAQSSAPPMSSATETMPSFTEAPTTPTTTPIGGERSFGERAITTTPRSTTAGQDSADTEFPHTTVDAVTLAWTDAMCTDMLKMMDALVDDPAADENSPVTEYREAQRAYFEAISNVVSVILADVSQRQPPAIPDGEALHQAYLEYVGDYFAVTSEGAMNIDVAANTREAVIAAVNKVHLALEVLTAHDFGPDVTDDPIVNAAMDLAPTCQVFD